MATPSERQAVESPWKHAPTTINMPRNPARTSQPVPQSGSNPFGKVQQRAVGNGQRKVSKPGNPIAGKTLAGRLTDSREPPNKKLKMSHEGAGPGFSGDRRKEWVVASTSASEVIIVDDDTVEDQRERRSRYMFKSEAQRDEAKKSIVPSGKNTTEVLDKYKDASSPPKVASPQVDLTAESDDIESFSDSPKPPPPPRARPSRLQAGVKGMVMSLVQKIEAENAPSANGSKKPSTQTSNESSSAPRRLDLRTVPPPPGGKSKMRAKLHISNSPLAPKSGASSTRKDMDSIATSPSFKPKPTPKLALKTLPVQEAMIGAQHHESDPESQLFVTCDFKKGLSLVKQHNDASDTQEILFEVPLQKDSNLVCNYGSTIVQFSTKSGAGSVVTIRLVGDKDKAAPAGSSLNMLDDISKFMRGLNANLSRVGQEEAMWEGARREAEFAEELSCHEVPPPPEEPSRMEQLSAIEARKRKNPCPDPEVQPAKTTTIASVFAAKRQESKSISASASTSASPSPAVPFTAVSANDRKTSTRAAKKTEPAPEPRRSGRTQKSAGKTPGTETIEGITDIQVANADEILLVYPPGAPGAVTITRGDKARLNDGQYLNDTLIEFALKLWMSRLEQERPELASQVHVFSSFFYKKLNSKRDPRQAYENVRKWTSKFDIFKKKYIIVPINEHYHWYLAIIYEPEHMLLETAPEKPVARKATRQATKVVEAELADALMQSEEAVDGSNATSDPPIGTDDKRSVDVDEEMTVDQASEVVHSPFEAETPRMSSEGEVERDLGGFEDSVRIEDPAPEDPPRPPPDPREKSPATLSYVSEKAENEQAMEVEGEGEASNSRPLSPTASDYGRTIHKPRRGSNASSNVNMSDPDNDEMLLQQGDGPIEQLSEENLALLGTMGPSEVEAEPGSPIAVSEGASASHAGGIPPTRFYGSIPKGKEGMKSRPKPKPRVLKREVLSVDDEDTQDVEMDVDMKPRTVIFTLDSLGTLHRAAVNKLAGYLQQEAADKKGIPNAGLAEGKQASVPAQPNFCDCGLYLIHFAQTFISDPEKYYKLSMAPKAKLHNQDAKENWNDKGVLTMRKDLQAEIEARSDEWKKSRPTKPEKEEEDSDEEVTFLSQNPATKGKAAQQKAAAGKKQGAASKPEDAAQKPDKAGGSKKPSEEPKLEEPRQQGKAARLR